LEIREVTKMTVLIWDKRLGKKSRAKPPVIPAEEKRSVE